MVHQSIIEARLSQLGIRNSRWFKPEIRELSHILMDKEKIIALVTGRYFGGFAMLVATNHRLLLIDKKVLFLTVEDIRYDMISEINFNSRLLGSTINIFTMNKQHSFTCAKHRRLLRDLGSYIQQRITEIRHYQQQSPPELEPAPQPERLLAPAARPIVRAASTVSQQLPKVMGSTAMRGAHWISINPYTKTSLLMRQHDWSRL